MKEEGDRRRREKEEEDTLWMRAMLQE